MNILVVDDEPLELEQLSYLIKKTYPQWNIFLANDAAEAKKLANNHLFPLALIDIQLPGDSGLDFSHWLKQQQVDTEIIIVTAFQQFDYAKEAIQLHVMDYLVKPIIEKELIHILAAYQDAHPETQSASHIIQEVIRIIHQEYSEKLNLTDLAQRIHVHGNYLSRKFSEELGTTFKDYLVSYRIDQAKTLLLKEPELTISQVAERVGFTSQHHFSHSFRKHMNMTPSQYRSQQP